MKITTEALLTLREGFGIVTATPAQRAACRIIDGLPLGELASHPEVQALVGGPEALAKLEMLESMGGLAPMEVVFLASVRSAKTIIAAAAAIRMSQTVDVSKLGPGEVPRVSLVSLKKDVSIVAFRLLLETVKVSKVLNRLLISETSETLILRHPSGRPIEVACVHGGAAGGGLVARWSGGAIFDEAPRMSGADDAVVNLDHARSAILGRLLPGAQALYIGSPWAPHGPVYDLVQERWSKPDAHLVVLRGTGPMLNPVWWTPERCQRLLEQDPTAYATDVQGEFADPESGLLSPQSVRVNKRESPLELPPEPGGFYAAAVDPSEGTAGGNGFALCIVQVVGAGFEAEREKTFAELHYEQRLKRLGFYPTRPTKPEVQGPEPMHERRFRVALAREFRGMRPEQIWEQIAGILARYGLKTVHSDQYAASAHKDLAARHGLTVHSEATTAASKLEDWTNFATLMHTDCIEVAPERDLVNDLLSVKRRTTQTGTTIVLPRTSDGRHCDLAAALCSAVKRAGQLHRRGRGGPTLIVPSERR